METFVARAGEHLGGYQDDELRALYDEGHFLPTDNYWRDGMTDWGTLADLFNHDAGASSHDLAAPAARPPRSAAYWILTSSAVLVIIIVGVVISVTYLSRKMAEAAAPVMTAVPTLDSGTIAPLAGPTKPADLLPVPDAGSDSAASAESKAVMKQLDQLSSACRDSEKDMLLLGFDPARLTSLEEIEKRQQSITVVLPRVQAVVDFLANLDTKVRADLQAQNVSVPEIDAFISDMHRNRKQEVLLQYWQEENAIALTMLENLQLLQENYGKWHLDSETVIFNDPAMLAAYRTNVEKLKADIATQQTAQAALKQSATDTPPPNP